MATTDGSEKPFYQKNKVLYTLLVVVLVVGALVALAITGSLTVTSEQIISFGEYVLGFLIGGHSLQRGLGYLARGIAARNAPPDAIEPEPEDKDEPEDEPKDEEKSK